MAITSTPRDWDLRGRTVLVTGGSGGIGFETARCLARQGAHVIITGRDAERGAGAAAAIGRERDNGPVTFIQADHATVGGNQALADQVRAAFGGLDVLINNVGGLYGRRWETADGYEATLAMNLVGPYALTGELLPLLKANAPSRCVTVGSAAFRMVKGDPFEDVQAENGFIGGDAYARTKLLNLLFGLALARRVAPDRVTVNLVHPGASWTDMTRSQTPATMPSWRWIWPIVRLAQRRGSPRRAARRVAYLASSPEAGAFTGGYFERGHTPRRLSARELDVELQERAWRLAAELVAAAPTNRRTWTSPAQAGQGWR